MSGKQVLVVDDMTSMRRIVAAVIKGEGHTFEP